MTFLEALCVKWKVTSNFITDLLLFIINKECLHRLQRQSKGEGITLRLPWHSTSEATRLNLIVDVVRYELKQAKLHIDSDSIVQ